MKFQDARDTFMKRVRKRWAIIRESAIYIETRFFFFFSNDAVVHRNTMFVFSWIHDERNVSYNSVSAVKLYFLPSKPPCSLYENNVDGRKRITKKVTVCIKLLIKCLTVLVPEPRQVIRRIKVGYYGAGTNESLRTRATMLFLHRKFNCPATREVAKAHHLYNKGIKIKL